MQSEANKLRALESMLADEDPATRKLVLGELSAHRSLHEETVKRLTQSTIPCVCKQASTILANWGIGPLNSGAPSQPQAGSMQGWPELEELCWQISETHSCEFSPDQGVELLDEIAESVRPHLPDHPCAHPEETVEIFSTVISEELGFSGNVCHYYEPENSILHCVLERRLGIPLSLSLVYIFTAHRLGLEFSGVNTPGHYLTRYQHIVFDPFDDGNILSPCELSQRFNCSPCCWSDPTFYRASPFQTAKRMLHNLVNAYARKQDTDHMQRYASYIQFLDLMCKQSSCPPPESS